MDRVERAIRGINEQDIPGLTTHPRVVITDSQATRLKTLLRGPGMRNNFWSLTDWDIWPLADRLPIYFRCAISWAIVLFEFASGEYPISTVVVLWIAVQYECEKWQLWQEACRKWEGGK